MLRAVFSFSLMTFISRMVGLIRDMLIAQLFGASVSTDAFFVAFRIPNLFRRVFAEGAFNLSFMPILAEAKNNPAFDEKDFIARCLGILTTVVMLFALFGSIFAPVFIFVLAPGLGLEATGKASSLLRLMFPYIALISLSSFFQSILYSYHRFALGAITPVFLNISFILCLLFLAHRLDNPIYALAIAVLIGGVLQFIWPFYFVSKLKVLSKPKFKNNSLTRKTMKNMLPIIFSSSVSQINILINTLLASLLISSSISWLYFANRLLEMPIGLVGVALSTVGIAYLSIFFQKGQTDKFNHSAQNSLSIAIIFGIASFLGLFVLAEPIMVSLFQYGNFEIKDSIMSANALKAYSLGLPMILITKVLSSVFFAQKNSKTPSKIAVISVGINLTFSLILMQFFAYIGLALASSIAAFSQALLLSLAIIKDKNLSIFKLKLIKRTIYAVLLSAFLLGFLILIFKQFGIGLEAKSWAAYSLIQRISFLSLFVLSFALIYLFLVNLLIMPIKSLLEEKEK